VLIRFFELVHTFSRTLPQVARREPSIAQPPPAHSTPAATQQQQLAQAFMGLPIAGGLPMAVGMSPGMMGMLPHFSQVISCHFSEISGKPGNVGGGGIG